MDGFLFVEGYDEVLMQVLEKFQTRLMLDHRVQYDSLIICPLFTGTKFYL